MSITLTNAATINLNGATAESDANAAATAMNVTFPTAITITFAYGTTSGQNFTPGTKIATVDVTINLVTGAWSATNGVSGTLSPGALTSFKSTVTGWRNSTETFAVNNNILIGSTVAWT